MSYQMENTSADPVAAVQSATIRKHDHKYFMFETKTAFVPYKFDSADIVTGIDTDNTVLYIREEYAVLACNCGSVIKKMLNDD